MGSTTKPLVLLTGPNGFVGAHVLDHLLTAGYRVRGTVRSQSKASFLEKKYASSHASDISFVIVPDIQAEHALDAAIADVDYVCHVASPYFTSATDPVKELIEPAVNGTRNVMSSALKAGNNLKRLTIMSSFAAVVDLTKSPRPGYVYTDADWDPVTPEKGAKDGYWGYHASKTFAESAAWDMWRAAEPKPKWDLVTFCPPMVYGPPIHEIDVSKGAAGLNTSLKNLVRSVTGNDPLYAPKVGKPGLPAWVDVRDVAAAHVNALTLPRGTSERFLLCGGVDYFEDGLQGLRSRGERGLGEVGERVDRKNHFSLDKSKAEKLLGLKFIPFEKTVEDVWERVKEVGLLG